MRKYDQSSNQSQQVKHDESLASGTQRPPTPHPDYSNYSRKSPRITTPFKVDCFKSTYDEDEVRVDEPRYTGSDTSVSEEYNDFMPLDIGKSELRQRRLRFEEPQGVQPRPTVPPGLHVSASAEYRKKLQPCRENNRNVVPPGLHVSASAEYRKRLQPYPGANLNIVPPGMHVSASAEYRKKLQQVPEPNPSGAPRGLHVSASAEYRKKLQKYPEVSLMFVYFVID